jgi:ParB family chromosome partitioning protein
MQTILEIPLSQLHPHPKNANVMAAGRMKKLARHIEKTGRYEPLVVRPHPTIAGDFELINGHHRKRVLETLGRTHANCIVWDLDDAETLLLLATINRLGGEDSPGKRLDLIDALALSTKQGAAQLAALLPEEEDVLAKLLSGTGEIAAPRDSLEMPEAFTVFMAAKDKKALVAALAKTDRDPAVALLRWAERIRG